MEAKLGNVGESQQLYAYYPLICHSPFIYVTVGSDFTYLCCNDSLWKYVPTIMHIHTVGFKLGSKKSPLFKAEKNKHLDGILCALRAISLEEFVVRNGQSSNIQGPLQCTIK